MWVWTYAWSYEPPGHDFSLWDPPLESGRPHDPMILLSVLREMYDPTFEWLSGHATWSYDPPFHETHDPMILHRSLDIPMVFPFRACRNIWSFTSHFMILSSTKRVFLWSPRVASSLKSGHSPMILVSRNIMWSYDPPRSDTLKRLSLFSLGHTRMNPACSYDPPGRRPFHIPVNGLAFCLVFSLVVTFPPELDFESISFGRRRAQSLDYHLNSLEFRLRRLPVVSGILSLVAYFPLTRLFVLLFFRWSHGAGHCSESTYNKSYYMFKSTQNTYIFVKMQRLIPLHFIKKTLNFMFFSPTIKTVISGV